MCKKNDYKNDKCAVFGTVRSLYAYKWMTEDTLL